MRSLMRALRALVLTGALLLLVAPAAGAQDSAAGPGSALSPGQVIVTPEQLDEAPTGARLTPREALRIADATPEVRAARRSTPGLQPTVAIAQYVDPARYQVTYQAGSSRPVEVHVDPLSGRVVHVYEGDQVDWLLARGEEASIHSVGTNPWLWVVLLVLFAALLADPRRPLSLANADLLALVGMAVSFALYSRSHLSWSVPISFLVLLYLALRLGWAGVKGTGRLARPLPSWAGPRLLLGLLLALVALRVVINLVDSAVIDVGYASVVGGDRYIHGDPLYVNNDVHGDVYGPITYLLYGTFAAIFPPSGVWDSVPAAHAAALTWDLLTVVLLVFAGRRLRPGAEGTRLGLALAVAWCAYPLTLFGLASNVNDGLVAVLVLGAWLTIDSPPGRGALAGLASAAKFAPAAVAPILIRGRGPARTRDIVIAAAAAFAALAVPIALTLPDGGLREFWDTTLGYQAGRESPFSIWGQVDLGPLQTVVGVVVVGAGLALFWWPRQRTRVTVAALAAAMLVAVQLVAGYWFYYYVVWFVPLALVALLGASRTPVDEEPPAFGQPAPEAAPVPAG